nr:MBL fold metallo-hydrolase [Halogeometricum sp. CBA1124]
MRFGYEGRDGDACLLVDAGADVSPDRLLGPEDRLVGVCLTHAHLDHYRSLPTCLDEDVPVYASPATTAMAGDVLDVASERHDVTDRGVADALVGVDGWTTVCPGVRLHPLPAGHAPGAVGFLVRFDDGDDHHDVVVTGDFTHTDCAGAPGFQTDLATDVELLFLTAATASDPGDALTDALGDALERATAGGRTLVTAGALVGVHVATLVAAANAELDVSVPVRLVGQTAKLYDALGYDHDAVETVPVFDDPRTCLTPGTVTIAGPEVPVDDSSERLYGELKDDADAALVQLVTSGSPPVQTGGCVSTHYELSMHPTESGLRSVVTDLEPIQTVLTHCRGTDEYNDLRRASGRPATIRCTRSTETTRGARRRGCPTFGAEIPVRRPASARSRATPSPTSRSRVSTGSRPRTSPPKAWTPTDSLTDWPADRTRPLSVTPRAPTAVPTPNRLETTRPRPVRLIQTL